MFLSPPLTAVLRLSFCAFGSFYAMSILRRFRGIFGRFRGALRLRGGCRMLCNLFVSLKHSNIVCFICLTQIDFPKHTKPLCFIPKRIDTSTHPKRYICSVFNLIICNIL
nr:MAG TPA: hypothetical protein [Bacteriophage sp.]